LFERFDDFREHVERRQRQRERCVGAHWLVDADDRRLLRAWIGSQSAHQVRGGQFGQARADDRDVRRFGLRSTQSGHPVRGLCDLHAEVAEGGREMQARPRIMVDYQDAEAIESVHSGCQYPRWVPSSASAQHAEKAGLGFGLNAQGAAARRRVL
jgi:hypothetical protein